MFLVVVVGMVLVSSQFRDDRRVQLLVGWIGRGKGKIREESKINQLQHRTESDMQTKTKKDSER